MAGIGLLGYALAGAVKGGAEAAEKNITVQNEYNLRKALQDSEVDMRMRLEQSGIKMKQQVIDDQRSNVRWLLDSVRDPNEGKGGHETDEMKAATQRSKLDRQKQALVDAGYLEEADKLDNQLARLDKTEATTALAEIKRQQVDNTFAQGQEKLRLQGEANAAKTEAAAARASNTKQHETDADKEYSAYVADVQKNGRKDGNGKKSYIPLSRDKWANWNRNQDSRRKQKTGTESRKSTNVRTGEEVTITRPLVQDSQRINSDPLGLFTNK